MALIAYQVLALEWTLLVLTLACVIIRVYVRLTTIYRPWREILVVIAWLELLARAIIDSLMFLYADKVKYLEDYDGLADYKKLFLWKSEVASYFFGEPIGLDCCRAVLLLLYSDLCPRHSFPKINWVIHISWVLMFCHLVGVVIVYSLLSCAPAPLAVAWSFTEMCVGQINYLLTRQSFSVFLDLVVFIIPIFILGTLKNMTITQRIGVGVMFWIGFINVALLGFGLAAWVVEMEFPDVQIINGTMSNMQMVTYIFALPLPTGIILICIPQLRVLGRTKFGLKAGQALKSISGRNDDTAVATIGSADIADTGAIARGAYPGKLGSVDVPEVLDVEKGIPPVVKIKSVSEIMEQI